MIGLVGAIQFLTRVPLRSRRAASHASIVPWFPFVGALIGAFVGASALALGELLPHAVAACVAVVAGVMVTGAFHEDGLADVADAFGGGSTRQRRLEILKDPRHGTYGVAALSGSIVLRVVCAASIIAPSALFASFVAAHTLGRAAAVTTLVALPPASESGLGADHARDLRRATAITGVAAGLAICGALVGWWIVPFVAAATVGALVTGWLAMRKIGGIAGDVLGAVEQVVECLVLVCATGLAARHTVWWSQP